MKAFGMRAADASMQKNVMRSCKDRIAVGIWNIMNMGKFNIVKDEKNQLHIDILGIRYKVKWTGIESLSSKKSYCLLLTI